METIGPMTVTMDFEKVREDSRGEGTADRRDR
jgi:hypothetical protein